MGREYLKNEDVFLNFLEIQCLTLTLTLSEEFFMKMCLDAERRSDGESDGATLFGLCLGTTGLGS
jgi:hypothetical protein